MYLDMSGHHQLTDKWNLSSRFKLAGDCVKILCLFSVFNQPILHPKIATPALKSVSRQVQFPNVCLFKFPWYGFEIVFGNVKVNQSVMFAQNFAKPSEIISISLCVRLSLDNE